MPASSQVEIILNLLYAGEKVQITFPSAVAQETFRKKLYAKKVDQDAAIIFLLGERKKVLHRGWAIDNDTGEVIATFWMETESPTINFPYIILDQEEENVS